MDGWCAWHGPPWCPRPRGSRGIRPTFAGWLQFRGVARNTRPARAVPAQTSSVHRSTCPGAPPPRTPALLDARSHPEEPTHGSFPRPSHPRSPPWRSASWPSSPSMVLRSASTCRSSRPPCWPWRGSSVVRAGPWTPWTRGSRCRPWSLAGFVAVRADPFVAFLDLAGAAAFTGASVAAFSGLAVTRRSATAVLAIGAWVLEATLAGTGRALRAGRPVRGEGPRQVPAWLGPVARGLDPGGAARPDLRGAVRLRGPDLQPRVRGPPRASGSTWATCRAGSSSPWPSRGWPAAS